VFLFLQVIPQPSSTLCLASVAQQLVTGWILENIKLQALHNFQIGLHDDIKLLFWSQQYRTLQKVIAGASVEEKVRSLNKKSTQYFLRGKTGCWMDVGRTQTTRNSTVQCRKYEKTGHYGRDYRTSRYANKFAHQRRINTSKWIRWKNIALIARKPDTVGKNAGHCMNVLRNYKNANRGQTTIKNRRSTLLP